MNTEKKEGFVFGTSNYRLLFAGIALVVVGFMLMSGGGSEDPTKFNGEELFSARRITVAPLTVLLGYVVVLYSILKKHKA